MRSSLNHAPRLAFLACWAGARTPSIRPSGSVCVNSLCNALGIDLPHRRLIGARSPVAQGPDNIRPSATANQVRLVLHTAAFWLMHGVRAAIPQTSSLAKAEFATIRERLIKIGARVIEHAARIRIHLPSSCPDRSLFRTVALSFMPCGP